jgi:uncharacterized caspase-like protein
LNSSRHVDALGQDPQRRGLTLIALAAAVGLASPIGAHGWEGRFPASYELLPACEAGGKAGKVRGLLVGIDEYREVDSAGRPWFAPLAGSANDAHLLEQLLERRGGAARADVRVLVDQDATSDGLNAALNDLIRASRCGDFVLFHFSGHTWRGALALADASVRNGSGLLFEGELRRAITAIRNRGAFVLVHIDANLPEPLQLDVGRGARWRAAGARGEAGIELAMDAGGFAGFYAGPLAFEQKIVLPKAEGGQDTRVYGLFSFVTAGALGSGSLPALRDLADQMRNGLAARGRAGLQPAPVFEATEPDRVVFARGLSATSDRKAPPPSVAAAPRTAAPQPAPAPAVAPVVAARSIEITEPKRMRGVALVTTPTLRIAGKVQPAEAVSGVVVQGAQAKLLDGGQFEAQVELKPGLQSAYVVAVFRDHSIVTENIEIQGGTQPVIPASTGRSYVLVIGNSDYQHIPKLQTPGADAEAIARTLKAQFGFETSLEIDDGKPLSLVLKNAGRREIYSALSQLRRRLGTEDALLVFYAGHGDRPEGASQAYWLPIDAEADDYAAWISADDIASQIQLMNARHVLVVADSCFSGGLIRGASPVAPKASSERARYIEEVSRRRSRHLMSSGANEPVMDSGGGGHSVFAAAFLKGLGTIKDEAFTAQQLFSSYVQESVAGKAGQTPQYGPIVRSGHEGGDFVFRRRPAAGGGSP